MVKPSYSRQLKLHYTTDGSDIVFEDGVRYSQRESFAVSKCSVKDLRLIHSVKKVFDGVLTYPLPRKTTLSELDEAKLHCDCGSVRFLLSRRGAVADIRCRECGERFGEIAGYRAAKLVRIHPGYEWYREPVVIQEKLL